MRQRTYIAIDLKSFYASVECRERGLDPLDTNLVVADESRTDKTICLAVTPSLKSYGISGRGRLFEVKQRVKESNVGRQHDAPGHRLDGTSHFFSELQANPSLAIDFIIAPPRMAYYIIKRKKNYSVVYNYVDENGETKQKWETWHTHKEALKRKAEIENQQHTGTFLPPSNQTITEFLYDFVSLYGEKKWGVSMYDSQTALIANYINPIIGDIRTSIWWWHFPMDGPVRIGSFSKSLQSSVRTQGCRRWSFTPCVIPVPPTN